MPSVSWYVDSLLVECGKSSQAIKQQFERKAGEIALEIIRAAGGRFNALAKTQTISILTTTTRYKLNADFNVARKSFAEYNSDDEFVRLIYVISKTGLLKRKQDDAPSGATMCYIEFDNEAAAGRGWYLILGKAPAAATTYKFDYYRQPTEQDIDVIEDSTLMKRGIRAQFPELFTTAQVDAAIYLKRMPNFVEDPSETMTDMVLSPSAKTRKRNRLARKIGKGY